MNTFHNKYDPFESLIFEEGLKIKSLEMDASNNKMIIHLNGDLLLVAPIDFFAGLKKANASQLKNFKIIGSASGIHWPELDEDLSLKGFLKEYLRQRLQKESHLTIS